jgi:5-formyltetrahydrofolate cyclo-ligase
MEWIPQDRLHSPGRSTGPVICQGTSKAHCTSPETDAMTKKEARQFFRGKRAEISAAQMEKWKDLMLIRFQQAELPFLHTVHHFLPIEEKKEPDPEPLIRYLEFTNPGLRIIVPKVVDPETNWISCLCLYLLLMRKGTAWDMEKVTMIGFWQNAGLM